MLKRLFIKLPLYILFIAACCTGIIPLLYWIIIGDDFTDLIEDIGDI